MHHIRLKFLSAKLQSQESGKMANYLVKIRKDGTILLPQELRNKLFLFAKDELELTLHSYDPQESESTLTWCLTINPKKHEISDEYSKNSILTIQLMSGVKR